ncbi:hypothetical protein PENTCL1PPCAC_17093, partial [Pristionchus entomophagus]
SLIIFLPTLLNISLVEYGFPGWYCDEEVMKKSASVPKSVHSLRFADINVIGAIGDSLTAGNGAGASNENDPQELRNNFRGLTFSVGGDMDLGIHITLANILKKFNPKLFGYSKNSGLTSDWANAQLNVAVSGATAANLSDQAKDLIQKIKDHPDKVDIAKDWKLIHLLIGANDFCAWCDNPEDESPALFGKRIKEAIQILKENLPRTIVVVSGMIDMTVVKELGERNSRCIPYHNYSCPCVQNTNFTTEQMRGICKEYMREEDDIQKSGIFDTVIVQPFFEKYDRAPFLPNGNVDLPFFAPDCFHFSQYGHSVVGKSLWYNLLEPIGSKSTSVNLTDLSSPLNCPDPSCPFIRTTKNSQDCGKYMT